MGSQTRSSRSQSANLAVPPSIYGFTWTHPTCPLFPRSNLSDWLLSALALRRWMLTTYTRLRNDLDGCNNNMDKMWVWDGWQIGPALLYAFLLDPYVLSRPCQVLSYFRNFPQGLVTSKSYATAAKHHDTIHMYLCILYIYIYCIYCMQVLQVPNGEGPFISRTFESLSRNMMRTDYMRLLCVNPYL